MANTTIYPYGTNGQLPDSIGIINDLTTGGADKALSAEMGKELNKSKLGITDNDIEVINQPILDMIGVKDVDYWIVNDMGFSAWNGNLQAKTGYNIAVVKARRTVMSFKGQTVSDVMAFWSTASEPSLEDLTVDTEGNAISYSKSNYSWSSTVTGKEVTKGNYYLINIGTSSDITLSFINGFPSEDDKQYTIQSVNDGKSFTASSLQGVDFNTMSYIRGGMMNCINQLDPNSYIDGMWIQQKNNPKVEMKDGYKMLCQEIPAGTTTILLRGYRGHPSDGYWVHSALLDENLDIVTRKEHSYVSSALQDVYSTIPTGAKYIAVNIFGERVPASISDLLLIFNVSTLEGQKYYDELYAMRNENNIAIDYEYEDGFPVNQVNHENLVAVDIANNGSYEKHTFEFSVGENDKFIYWYLPTNGYDSSCLFIQYDSEGNVLKSGTRASYSSLIWYGDGTIREARSLVKLESGCAKISISTREYTGSGKTVTAMQNAGCKIYLLPNRIIPHRKPRLKSINGILLNNSHKLPLEGLTICCIGDSVTEFGSHAPNGSNGGWPARLQFNYDCACYNYARGNAHFIDYASTDPTYNVDPTSANGDPKNVFTTQVRWMLREMSEEGVTPDVVVIGGGGNDCCAVVNYGDLDTAMVNYGDTTDAVKTTFYDACVYMVSKIRAAYPNVKIFFGTHIKDLLRSTIGADGKNQNQRLGEWREHMILAARALSCGVIDWYAESGIVDYPTSNNPFFKQNDLMHPSALGVAGMTKLAVSEISKAFPR